MSKISYDEYYQTENLFGDPYPVLLKFFAGYPPTSRVLDLGCGQGRDAIALARMGFDVTGIDISTVGIEQMNQLAQIEKLRLKGVVADVYEYDDFGDYDFVLLDSMLHFNVRDRAKETDFLKRIKSHMREGSLLVCCIQDIGQKVQLFNQAIDSEKALKRITDIRFKYVFVNQSDGHSSTSDYRMVDVEV